MVPKNGKLLPDIVSDREKKIVYNTKRPRPVISLCISAKPLNVLSHSQDLKKTTRQNTRKRSCYRREINRSFYY